MKNIILFICFVMFSSLLYAQPRLTLGVKILAGEWSVVSGASVNNIKQKGSQSAINLMYQNNKYFAGINLQGGEYNFLENTPDQITQSGAQSVTGSVVKHGEFDLLAGYYFFRNVAFFIDLKTISDKWQSNNYQQDFSGLGIGVSGFYPLDEKWMLYGNLGFIGKGSLIDKDKQELASASSGALELAAAYSINNTHSVSFGIKSRTYTYVLESSQQVYSIGGLFFNYQYHFYQ